ncbi:hypothetical protein ANN_23741 [Periplaneta americana]|uniref:Uncharacterized protein n=1 Tax=Periplaneta americana TaxID=6978 RepID=A0ABQ8SP02_PERAM|nr:hypothetical protein ANN_23741 [Periplaneta americana]
MDLREVGYDDRDWINLAQDRERWRAYWTLRRSEEKRIQEFEMWTCRRMERVKWTDSIRNEAVLKREGEKRMILTDQEDKKELVGSLAEKKLPSEGFTGRNGEREKSSGHKNVRW